MKTVIGIVGGGFSGTLLAHHLRHPRHEVLVFDKPENFGRGVAYSTSHPEHRLNVAKEQMGAWTDKVNGFDQWLRNRERLHASSFVPRSWYGEYLSEILEESKAQKIPHEVVSANPFSSKWTLRTAAKTFECDHLILACGNETVAFDPDDVTPAWEKMRSSSGKPLKSAVILGSGLTAVDVALQLLKESPAIRITMLSRHGSLPQPHSLSPYDSTPHLAKALLSLKTLRSRTRYFRKTLAKAEAARQPWQNLFEDLRPLIQELWMSMSLADQKRFLKFVRPYWDTHRHRLAPDIWNKIEGARRSGQIRVVAGRWLEIDRSGRDCTVHFYPRGEQSAMPLITEAVFNALGPQKFSATKNPLLTYLTRGGHICPDALELGVSSQLGGQVLNARGEPVPGLWVMGSLQRGLLWECTAVAELRRHTENLAKNILAIARQNV